MGEDLVVEVRVATGSVPEWASKVISEQEIDELDKVISQLERECQAEVVPVIASQSLPALHLRRWVMTLLTLFTLTVLLVWVEFWGWVTLQKFIAVLITGLFLSAVAAIKLGSSAWVLRWVTHPKDIESFVWQRAELEFYRHRMHDTRQRSGLLLFVSLAEKKTVILVDPAVTSYIPKELMKGCVEDIAKGAAGGHLYNGLVNAIERLRPTLLERWPAGERDLDELSNRVRFVGPLSS